MAQYENHSTHTHVPREPVRESTGTGTLAFIIGGLVVAVGIIAWILMAGDIENGTATVPAEGGDASVTVTNPPAAADDGAAMESAPAIDGDATAPAPADDAAPAPVEEAPAN